MSIIPPDDKDPPIEPQEYVGGVRVVDIGDARVSRGMSRRPYASCSHRHLHYDSQERRVWCPDCEKNIDPFDAFTKLVEHFHQATGRLKRREAAIVDSESHTLISRAAKRVDEAWRSRTTAPGCPSCHEALLPEDFADGIKSRKSLELARAKRKAAKAD